MTSIRNRTAIIILNYNGWKDTFECLDSIYQINHTNYDVIVLDNGSTNDSVKKIKEYAQNKSAPAFKSSLCSHKPLNLFEVSDDGLFDKQKYELYGCDQRLILIKNKHNDGFAKGNNLAIIFSLKNLESDYILLLNNDTVVEKSFLSQLLLASDFCNNIAILAPKIYFYNYCGRKDVIYYAGEDFMINRAAEGKRYGMNHVDNGLYNGTKEVDKVDGACMLVKAEVFRQCGLLDPAYFVYWEETDFCFRVKAKGFKTVYVSDALVWHKQASSIGGPVSPLRVYYYTKNRYVFLARNFDGNIKIRFLLYLLGYNFWLNFGFYMRLRRLESVQSFLKGTIDGLLFFLKFK